MLTVVKSSTKDKDRGRLRILSMLNAIDGAHADIGLFEGEQEGPADYGELNIAEIGAIHEFGAGIRHGRSGGMTITVPERSWLRSNHDKNVMKYNKRLDRSYDRILRGKSTVLGSLTGFAEKVAGDVRRNITDLSEPPITEATKQSRVVKGTSNPLVDTGTMRQSVRGRVLLHGTRF